MKWNIIIPVILPAIFCLSILAAVPTDKMMLMDIHRTSMLNSKNPPADTRFSFEELNDVGINAILVRVFDYKGYSKWEFVNEAHEYGFWVAGFPDIHTSLDALKESSASLAATGMDFMQLDEPFDWGLCTSDSRIGWSFDENGYKQAKAAVAVVAKNVPIIATDVNCNSKLFNWSSLDGIFNEMYFDDWYSNYMPPIVNYQNNNPSKFVGNWVWLLNYGDNHNGVISPYISDSQFKFWTTETRNKLGNVMFFIFSRKAKGTSNTANGAGWSTKGPIIKGITGGGKPLPDWKNFTQSSAITTAPDFSVQVRAPKYGLDTASVQVLYTADVYNVSRTKWVRHLDFSVSAEGGSTGWVTIRANRVPFDTVGTGNEYLGQRVRFKIKDNYAGITLRSPRFTKKTFGVSINEMGWTNFSGNGPVDSLNPDFTLNVQNSSGLDVESVGSEYSIDGGKSWVQHPAVCSGNSGSTALETVTVKSVPFVEDKPGANLLRLSIKNSGGKVINSPTYTVRFEMGPAINGLVLSRNGQQVDVSVTLQDKDGLSVGSQSTAQKTGTIAYYPLNSTVNDLSRFGSHGSLQNGAVFAEKESWKTGGTTVNAACFDGSGDYADMGAVTMGKGTAITLSGRVWAENNYPFLNVGHNAERGAILASISAAGQLSLIHWDVTYRQALSTVSPVGVASLNKWHHFTFTSEGTGGKLYLDGQLVATNEASTFQSFAFQPLRLAMPSHHVTFFKGCVSELHVMSRALSEAEVAAEFYSGMARVSSDSGKTWSNWEKGSMDIADGSTDKGTMALSGLTMPEKDDGSNRIEISARDLYGNTSLRQYVIMGGDAVPVNKKKVLEHKVLVASNKITFPTFFAGKINEVQFYSLQGEPVHYQSTSNNIVFLNDIGMKSSNVLIMRWHCEKWRGVRKIVLK
ncbi:MAG: LamG domain-containing protein [Fibrobacteria bacterium]|nr:LamG domain-containing protein [Fibrobacteria bacterium]